MNYKASELSTAFLEREIKQLQEANRFCLPPQDRAAIRETISEYREELNKRIKDPA